MIFSTTLFSGTVRVSEAGFLEVYTEDIQHKRVKMRNVGFYSGWKKILVDKRPVVLKDAMISNHCVYTRPFVDSRIIWKGKYFIDTNGVLCDQISVCLPFGKFYFGTMFVFMNGQPVEAMSL